MTEESALKFPCAFPIKAMGHAGAGLDTLVVEIVRRHAPDLSEAAVRTRPSRHGNYVSVTVTVPAQDRAQLDAIYRDLSAEERILMVL